MKQKIQAKDVWLLAAQLLLLSLIMLSPGLISYISSRGDVKLALDSLWIAFYWLTPAMVVYLLNFYRCIPLLWYRHRYWLFGAVNVVLISITNLHLFGNNLSNLPDYFRAGYFSLMTVSLLLCLMAIGIALSVRYMMRRSERKQKEVEAELAWLKNQINPHFLFNTLNNISSLTQIDPDAAQDAIAQLSDLLRYAMYETNKKTVPISGEVEFMRNYISLMKLRCNEKTEVKTTFNVEQDVEIAPLLFISLIENAFKHGVSSSRKSLIDISLSQDDKMIVFACENTNYPKTTDDRSGSGIGLENTRRRLDLVYHDKYEWEQNVEDDMYKIKITIKL